MNKDQITIAYYCKEKSKEEDNLMWTSHIEEKWLNVFQDMVEKKYLRVNPHYGEKKENGKAITGKYGQVTEDKINVIGYNILSLPLSTQMAIQEYERKVDMKYKIKLTIITLVFAFILALPSWVVPLVMKNKSTEALSSRISKIESYHKFVKSE